MAGRILVTGASGFVGRHLLALLGATESASELHAWSRTTPGDGDEIGSVPPAGRIHWQSVDVRDREAISEGVAEIRPTEVYHLAGVTHVVQSRKDVAGTLDINVTGTHALLEALRRLAIDTRVLISGSATIYAPSSDAIVEESPLAPTNPYSLSKLAQEMLGLHAFTDDNQQVLLARAFNHVGAGQDPTFFAPAFAHQLAQIERGLASPRMHVGDLDVRRDLTDVRDTVHAYRALMKRGTPGRPYNVCSGHARRIGHVLDTLIERFGLKVQVDVDPARLRPDDAPLILGSFKRLHSDTGWRPRIPFEETIADLVADARGRVSAEAAG